MGLLASWKSSQCDYSRSHWDYSSQWKLGISAGPCPSKLRSSQGRALYDRFARWSLADLRLQHDYGMAGRRNADARRQFGRRRERACQAVRSSQVSTPASTPTTPGDHPATTTATTPAAMAPTDRNAAAPACPIDHRRIDDRRIDQRGVCHLDGR